MSGAQGGGRKGSGDQYSSEENIYINVTKDVFIRIFIQDSCRRCMSIFDAILVQVG